MGDKDPRDKSQEGESRFSSEKPLSASLEVGDIIFSRSGSRREVVSIEEDGNSKEFEFKKREFDGRKGKKQENFSADKLDAASISIGYVLTKNNEAIIISDRDARDATLENKRDFREAIEGVKGFQEMVELQKWMEENQYMQFKVAGKEVLYADTESGQRDQARIAAILALYGQTPIFQEYSIRLEKMTNEKEKIARENNIKEQRDAERQLREQEQRNKDADEAEKILREITQPAKSNQETIAPRSIRDKVNISEEEMRKIERILAKEKQSESEQIIEKQNPLTPPPSQKQGFFSRFFKK